MDMDRDVIFISHATPEDNGFAAWLAMRLMSYGYTVWCDVFNLTKGGDFWKKIERAIRERTCKFLPVMTKVSNGRPGVIQEVMVAADVGKALRDTDFIIPLRIDPELSFGSFDPRLITYNAVDFSDSWAEGLATLLDNLEKFGCPRTHNQVDDAVLYEKSVLEKITPIKKEEVFDSNWFLLSNLPIGLNFFPMVRDGFDCESYPVLTYRHNLVTFLSLDMLPRGIQDVVVKDTPPIQFSIKEFLRKDEDCDFIKASTFRWLCIGLLAKVFELSMRQRVGVCTKQMANKRVAFYYPTGVLEKDKVHRIALIGKHKALKWHFAISGNVKLFPAPMIQMRTHLLFSTRGNQCDLSDEDMQRARRALGKSWWNKEWRDHLLAFMTSLVNEDGLIALAEGVPRPVVLSSTPIQFRSDVAYVEPGSEEGLDDVSLGDVDDEEVVTEHEEEGVEEP